MKIKKNVVFLLLLLTSINFAQKKVSSPAETVTGKINGATITVNYGSPSVRGRAIWGGLVPFDKIWRAGANEATTFETDKNILIEGKELPAGKYSFFIIPNDNESVLIFNKELKLWGAYEYKASNDQLRVTVKNKMNTSTIEKLEYKITGTRIEMLWEKWIIGFNVQ